MSAVPRLVLVGAPGAGKSAVGAELARRWGVDFRDTDSAIEVSEGRTVSDIFVELGESTFRRLEEEAVATALTQCRGVVALGGGAVLAARTRAHLADVPVAFLDVSLPAACDRVGLGHNRPLLLGGVRAQLRSLLDARRPLYLEVATFTVATDDGTVEQVADEVERHLR